MKNKLKAIKEKLRLKHSKTKILKYDKNAFVNLMNKVKDMSSERLPENIENVELQVCSFCESPIYENDCTSPLCSCKEFVNTVALDKEVLIVEKEIERQNNEKKAEKIVNSCGISKRQMAYSFENYNKTPENENILKSISDYLQNLNSNIEKGKGLLLTGGVGTGKTHLAVAAFKEIVNKKSDLSFKVCSLMEFLYELKCDFDKEKEIIDRYVDYDVLLLDDLLKEQLKDWGKQVLYLLINKRYEDLKTTIITTNGTSKELTEKAGSAITSRLVQSSQVVVFGKDIKDFRLKRS